MDRKPILFVMLGLPGSGKSTYVDELMVPEGIQVVCADDLRLAHGHRFYGPMEKEIHAKLVTYARAHMLRGLDIVIDECNERASYIMFWKRLAMEMGYNFQVIFMRTPMSVCMKRRELDDFPLHVIEDKAEPLKSTLEMIDDLVDRANNELLTVEYCGEDAHE